MDSHPKVVLITGVNGLIGYATAVKALQLGYHVAAAVRREDAVQKVLQGNSAQLFHKSGALRFSIVPDMTTKDAFLEAATGCFALIHIANPLGSASGEFHDLALGAIDALLHTARTIPSIKRIVWTGSTNGNFYPYEQLYRDHPTNRALAAGEDVPALTCATILPVPPPVAPTDSPMKKYGQAKAAALHKLRAAADPNASFDAVAIVPSWTIGPNEIPRSRKEAMQAGTNRVVSFMWDPKYILWVKKFMGLGPNDEAALLSTAVHLDDVAEAHVRALELPALVGNQVRTYTLATEGPLGIVYDDAKGIVEKTFPDFAAKMIEGAHLGTIPIKFDVSATERELLKRPFWSFEKIVNDVVGWYLGLPEQ